VEEDICVDRLLQVLIGKRGAEPVEPQMAHWSHRMASLGSSAGALDHRPAHWDHRPRIGIICQRIGIICQRIGIIYRALGSSDGALGSSDGAYWDHRLAFGTGSRQRCEPKEVHCTWLDLA
jgi:hypothetical protein